MRHTVFISRNVSECQALYERMLTHDYTVIAQSLITTKPVAFNPELPPCDWIFFSSSNAVRHFFNQHPRIQHQRLAALGEATAETLREYASPDFIGNAMDIADSSYRFADEVKDKIILFPIARHSMKSFQQAFPVAQIIELVVYETEALPKQIATADLYIFSSPSNVRSFFEANHVNPGEFRTLAFGQSTADELRSYGVENITIPQSLDPAGMLHTINHIFQG